MSGMSVDPDPLFLCFNDNIFEYEGLKDEFENVTISQVWKKDPEIFDYCEVVLTNWVEQDLEDVPGIDYCLAYINAAFEISDCMDANVKKLNA